ncbi:MAG: hypothetical protein IPH18_05300 [Chitinophagaceae bacterium]|nr:hypothetical protein [Chitinophagaceae bacterium]
MHQRLMSEGNRAALKGLMDGRQKVLLQADTTADITKKTALLTRSQEYEKLIGEYQLMIDSKPPALINVEEAKPSGRPDKPDIDLCYCSRRVLGFFFIIGCTCIAQQKRVAG